MRCSRCVLPEHKPDIRLDEGNLCNVCAAVPKNSSVRRSAQFLESDLIRLLNKIRGKGRYDCLVMCSGGKDSTSALYFATKRYRLNALAFTFDHGFGNDAAIENVRTATKLLKVDWLFYQSTFMHEFFSELIRTRARVPICPPCSLWYMQVTYDLARRYEIPLIITGWTRGQMDLSAASGSPATESEFPSLSRATAEFINRLKKVNPRYKDFPVTMEAVMKRYKGIKVLSPHWFLQDDAADYTDLITKELSWKQVAHSYPANSTNCYLNFVSALISMKYYGFTHYHIEMSNLIRSGDLSRQEALSALEIDFEEEPARSLIEGVLEQLGCTWEDLKS
jgi:hypothetical protein